MAYAANGDKSYFDLDAKFQQMNSEMQNSINQALNNFENTITQYVQSTVNNAVNSAVNSLNADINRKIDSASDRILNQVKGDLYPIGSIYITVRSDFNPATKFGGTWSKIPDGCYLMSVANSVYVPGDNNMRTPASTGGAFYTTIGINNIPEHTHGTDSSKTAPNRGFATFDTSTDIDGTGVGLQPNSSGGLYHVGYSKVTGKAGKASPNPLVIVPPYYTVYAWRRTG